MIPRVTACVPSIRGRDALATIFSVNNQQPHAPEEVVLYDSSEERIRRDEFATSCLEQLRVSVIDGPPVDQQTARSVLAEFASTEWLWFVDDDVWPWSNCLEKMLACSKELGSKAVGSHNLTPIRHTEQYRSPGLRIGPDQEMPARTHRQVPCLDTFCLLTRRAEWLSQDRSFIPDGRGGEDLYTTSALCAGGGCHQAAGAECLHMRQHTPEWSTKPLDKSWWERHLKPRLTPRHWQKLWTSMRPNEQDEK